MEEKVIRTPYIIKKKDVRIGFDAKRAFNNGTGLGNYSRYIIQTATTIFGRNVSYHLYTPSVKKELSYWTQGFNLVIHRPPRFFPKLLKSLWRQMLGKRLRKDRISLYHGLSNELPPNIDKKYTHSIVTIHDLIFLHFPESYKTIDRWIYKRKFRSACRRADLILATSQETRRDIMKHFGISEEKIIVHYQDCSDIYYFPPGKHDLQHVPSLYNVSGPYIICVSAFQKRKNHLSLIEAFARAQPLNQKLLLVGASGEMLHEVKTLIASKGLTDKVQIIENVRSTHLPTLYYNADFAVYPSLYEGFGIPLLEAMRMKLPVITNKDGCFREVSGDAALYADVSDAGDLSSKIRMLATDKHLHAELKRKVETELKRFEPDEMRKELKAIYERFIEL